MLSLWFQMSGENSTVYPKRHLPKRPEDLRGPSPTPLPFLPSEDPGKALQQILERLKTIEKRLENIEKLLMQRQTTP